MRESIGLLWCQLMHNSVSWPIHGQYHCQTCGRHYRVPWSGSNPASVIGGKRLPRPVSALLPAILLAMLLPVPKIRASEAIVNAVNGAADAFARYTTRQSTGDSWQVETVEIEASLPKLAKHGRLRAIRRLLPFGRPQYQVLEVSGDQMIKREVINRYLSEEARASELPPSSLAITPDNYKFRYSREMPFGNGLAYVFSVTPRKKREGLIKGELWLDAETGQAVRQTGYLVKRPSIFLKRIDIARDIELCDGTADLRLTHLTIDTRIAGRAELTIQERPLSNPAPEVSPE